MLLVLARIERPVCGEAVHRDQGAIQDDIGMAALLRGADRMAELGRPGPASRATVSCTYRHAAVVPTANPAPSSANVSPLRRWRVREVTSPKCRRWGPSRPRWSQQPPHVSSRARPRSAGIRRELPEHHVREPALQAPHGLHRRFPGGDLTVVVGAALGGMAELDHRHDVQGAVDLPVSRPG